MGVVEFTVDSRDRDANEYQEPNEYSLRLPIAYKNVQSVEINRLYIPQTQHRMDNHNNRLYYKLKDQGDIVSISMGTYNNDSTSDFKSLLNSKVDTSLFNFLLVDGHIRIINTYSTDITFYFSKSKTIGHLIGIPYDCTIQSGENITSPHKIIFQQEPYVMININGYSHIDDIDMKSSLFKHVFTDNYQPRQVKTFHPAINIQRLHITFTNYNTEPYNFHGHNHTFNVRIKYV